MVTSRLTDYFCQQNNIDHNAIYEMEKIDANQLITKDRIDLVAKLKYIEYREKGYDLTFIKELYTAHIEAFSHGTFIEPGNDDKNSIDKYFETFDSLIDDIKNRGFDETISVIPVGSNNAIMDGAHRVAIAAYFNLKVPIIYFNNISVTYDTKFFQDRLLDKKYIDYLVTEYCKMKKNVYFVCVWPKAKGQLQREKMNFLINESCEIIYKKNIKLNYDGLKSLIIQIYSGQDWIGCIQNDFSGARNKVNACYDNSEIITVYVLECESFDKVLKLKRNIGDVFNTGNDSIHIADTQFDTIRIANLLLNQNSVNFLNAGKPNYYTQFNRKINKFKASLIKHHFSLDEFIIDSSSTLGLYGLRNVEDIDFVTVSNGYEILEEDHIKNHHDCIQYYKTTADNLVLNPNNYFVYNDLKFITLDVLKVFKKNRNENKDKLDIKLIDNMVKKKDYIHLFLPKMKKNIKKNIRNSKYIWRLQIVKLLKKFDMYELVRNIYLYLKKKGCK